MFTTHSEKFKNGIDWEFKTDIETQLYLRQIYYNNDET